MESTKRTVEITTIVAKHYTETLSQSVSAKSSLSSTASMKDSGKQSVGITDNILGTFSKARSNLQSTNILDNILKTFQPTEAQVQTTNILSFITKTLGFKETKVQQTNILDTITETFYKTKTNLQSVNVLGSITKTLGFKEIQTQPTNILDLVTGEKIRFVHGYAEQNVSITDTVIEMFNPEEVISQGSNIINYISETFSITRRRLQITNITDTVIETFNPEAISEQVSTVSSNVYGTWDKTRTVLQTTVSSTTASIYGTFQTLNKQTVTASETVFKMLNYFTLQKQGINIRDKVRETQSLFTSFVQKVLGITSVTEKTSPHIYWTELNVRNLGNGNELKLRINTTDQDNNINKVEFNGNKKTVSGGVTTLDIDDILSQKGILTVTDNTGLKDTWKINFSLTNNNYKQIKQTYNLSYQELEKNDTLDNFATDNLQYNITHYTKGTVGENFTGTLTPDTQTILYTNFTGDLLTESLSKWKLRFDTINKNNTIYKQYIRKSLNITNNFDSFGNISVGNVSVPSVEDSSLGFEPCSNTSTTYSYCGNHNISFTGDYYTPVEWKDDGDGIERKYVENIADEVIGERTQWWEKYSYANKTSEPYYKNIVANETIQDSSIRWGGLVQVQIDGSWTNVTSTEEDNCDTLNPNLYGTDVNGTLYKSCYKYLNSTNVYFKLIIPEFNDSSTTETNYYIKYISYTTSPPPAKKPIEEGLECTDEGDTYETNETTLRCWMGKWWSEDKIPIGKKNVTNKLYQLVVVAIFILGFIIALILIFFEDIRNRTVELFRNVKKKEG